MFFSARRYASAVYALGCVSVRPSRSLSVCHKSVLPKRLNRITQSTSWDSSENLILDGRDLGKIPIGSPLTGPPNIGGLR